VMLSPRLLTVLRRYWQVVRPGDYLFPGRDPDRPLSPSAVQRICTAALRASGLKKRISPHSLRHNAASRIMPTETLVVRFLGLFAGPLDSALMETTRHNPAILSFAGARSARKERAHAQEISCKRGGCRTPQT